MKAFIERYIYIFLFLIFITISNSCVAKELISDNCYITKIKNKKIGYVCITQKIEDDKVVTIKHIQRSLNRFGFDINTVKEYIYTETLAGKPLSLKGTVETSGEIVELNAEFTSDNKIKVVRTLNNNEQIEEINLQKEILFPYAIKQLISNNNKPQFSYTTIDPANKFRIINVDYNKISTENHNELSDKPLDKYKISIDLIPSLGNYEWYDKQGNLYKRYSSILNTEEKIISKELLEVCQNKTNIFFKNLIPVDTYIKKPQDINNITYKIDLSNPVQKELFISDDRQRIIQSNKKTTYLKVFNEKPLAKKYIYPVNTVGSKHLLVSNSIIDAQNKDIIKIAHNILNGQNNPFNIVKEMEKWVNSNIEKDATSNHINNTAEILAKKSGNCIDHSVLLASLLRSVGIPSKVVIGLVYTSTPENSFSYHSWVKTFIGDWINLDPYYPQSTFSPVHISLYESDFNKKNESDFILKNLINSMANLKIAILNYNLQNSPIENIELTHIIKNNEKINVVNLLNAKADNDKTKNISLRGNDLEKINNIRNIKLKKYTKQELIRLGFYSYSQGEIEKAMESFEKAYKLIPHSSDFTDLQIAKKLASIGLFQLSQKTIDNFNEKEFWEKQVASIQKIYYPLIIPTGNNELIYSKALSLINFQNNPQGAISLIKTTPEVSLSVSDYANYIIAKAYFAKKDYASAQNFINRTISVNNKNLTYRLEKAKILNKNLKYKEAIKEIEYLLGQKYQDEIFKNQVFSLRYLILSNLLKNENHRLYYLAKHHFVNGEYSKVLSLLDKKVQNNDSFYRLYTLAGQVKLKQSKKEEASNLFIKALSKNKRDSDALISLADIEKSKKNYRNALKLYKKAQRYSKQKSSISVKIGEIFEENSDIDNAIKHYKIAVKQDPDNYLALYMLSVMTYDFGDKEEAKALLRKSISINPMFIKSWAQLALIEINDNNNFIAREYLIPIKFIDSNNPDYYYLSGLIALKNDNKTKAVHFFTKALSIDSKHRQARFELNQLKDSN